jgi:hypothetical protein
MMEKNKVIQGIWHPFFLVIYSVLALYNFNLGEVEWMVIFRPLLLMLLLTLLVLVLFRFIIKTWQKAGLLTTWSMLLFVSYGHVNNLISRSNLLYWLGRHRYLLPIFGLLFLLGVFLVIKKIRKPEMFSIIFNAIMLLLVLISVFSVSRYFIKKSSAGKGLETTASVIDLDLEEPQDPPDIYYILLDGYTRSDVLSEKFGYDNGGFVDQLEDLGFYVAKCSRSNYLHTHLVLPSLLNMDYVDSLYAQTTGSHEFDINFLNFKSKNNVVMTNLQSVGYQTVTFETSYAWAQFDEADFYFQPVVEDIFLLNITKFEELYLDTTMLSALLDWDLTRSQKFSQIFILPNVMDKNRVMFIIDQLKKLPEMENPQFVFAHLVIPHPPYIFNKDGVIPNLSSYDESWEEGKSGQQGYINNIQYINQEILNVVEIILSESATDPIIIIQSDHGSDFFDRSMNFSAFYFPGGGEEVLYPSITQVNTFRLVFNQYFGTQLAILPDVSLTGKYPPFDFAPIEETYPACFQ